MTKPNPQDRLTIIIVTWNSRHVLPGLLESMPHALAGIRETTLIVVDNGSDDGTIDLVRKLQHAVLVDMGRNAGYAAAINAGIAQAPASRAFLLLNPDVRLQPGSVAKLMEALNLPGTGLVVPRLVSPDGRLNRSLRREPTVLRALGEAILGGHLAGRHPTFGEVVHDARSYERPGQSDWASGAVMLIGNRCLQEVGLWDESFFLYSEETDFALRAKDAGFGLRFVPDAVAVHLGGDSHRSPRLWSILTVNRVKLFARRHGRLSTVAFWGAVVLNEGLRSVGGERRHIHRAGLRALVSPSRRPKR